MIDIDKGFLDHFRTLSFVQMPLLLPWSFIVDAFKIFLSRVENFAEIKSLIEVLQFDVLWPNARYYKHLRKSG